MPALLYAGSESCRSQIQEWPALKLLTVQQLVGTMGKSAHHVVLSSIGFGVLSEKRYIPEICIGAGCIWARFGCPAVLISMEIGLRHAQLSARIMPAEMSSMFGTLGMMAIKRCSCSKCHRFHSMSIHSAETVVVYAKIQSLGACTALKLNDALT